MLLMEQVRTSISSDNYLKFQILMKRPIEDFDKGLSEFMASYEKLEKYYEKNVKAFETMPLQVKDSDQCKRRVSL